MERRWTEGPWEVMNGGDIFGPLGGDSGDGVKADSNDGWQVAEVDVYHTLVDGQEVELSGTVRRANAQLIAAAPDLYEALELLYDHARLYMDVAENVDTAVNKALAKSRGE